MLNRFPSVVLVGFDLILSNLSVFKDFEYLIQEVFCWIEDVRPAIDLNST